MKRILILSDSLALPRETPEFCAYEDTWPQLIQGDHKIHQVSIGGATSGDLARQVKYISLFCPEIVIVQVGIVDCAPRFLTKFEQEVFKKIPFLGLRIMKSLNNSFIRKKRKISYVTPDEYQKNLEVIIDAFNRDNVWFIPIIDATPQYEEKLPGITKQVNLFNSRLRQISNNIFDLQGILENGLMSDFHHLNRIGHKIIAQQINSVVN